jgi:hypothetical protein
MKTKGAKRWIPWLAIIALAGLLAGCRTVPRVDWESRTGNYTYDQAILELGPPDKAAQLGDGTIVAEWLTYRGRPGYTHRIYSYRSAWDTYDPGVPDRFLRLTFDPDGMLRESRRVVK